jgi:hypothetical protein
MNSTLEAGAPRRGLVWAGVFAGFAALYLLSAQRGCSWGDSGIFQWRVLRGEYVGNGGKELALAHPLYIAMARLWLHVSPLGNPYWSMNFFSGLGMAVSLANLTVIFLKLTKDVWLSVLVAAMLGVAHTPWWLSTMAEVYTWSLAALTVEILLLLGFASSGRPSKLYALFFVNGLGLCIHNLALLALPVYCAVAIVSVRRARVSGMHLPGLMAAYAAGASPFLFLVGRLAVADGSLPAAIRNALVGTWGASVFALHVDRQAGLLNAALVSLNFLNLFLPLAVVGWLGRRHLAKDIAWPLGLITALHVAFVARYNVPDVFTFTLPSLAMISIFAAHGARRLAERSQRAGRLVKAGLAASVLLAPAAYGTTPSLLEKAGVSFEREGKQYPLRRELHYWITPWKQGERSAEEFSLRALQQAAPDGIIRSGNRHLLYPLLLTRFQHAEYRGVDAALYDKKDPDMTRLLAVNRHRPVFIDRPHLRKYITTNAQVRAEGVLYRVSLSGTGPEAR